MPALNVEEKFVELVELGEKCQTIRGDRVDGRAHCAVGDDLKLYTGMRTKQCRLIGTVRVLRIDRIVVTVTGMTLNGNHVPATLTDRDGPMTDGEFARADGFDDFCEMRDYLEAAYGPLPFSGSVIYWAEGSLRCPDGDT